MDGFEAVADIGQSAPDDHTHGVIEIGTAHLILDVDRDVILRIFAERKLGGRIITTGAVAARALRVFFIVCQAVILAFHSMFMGVYG